MKCAIPRTWELQHCKEGTASIVPPRCLLMALAALITTALWAAIIGVFCRAAGMSIGPGWFASLMVAIFALALLGQGLATRETHRAARNMSIRHDITIKEEKFVQKRQ